MKGHVVLFTLLTFAFATLCSMRNNEWNKLRVQFFYQGIEIEGYCIHIQMLEYSVHKWRWGLCEGLMKDLLWFTGHHAIRPWERAHSR